LPIAFTRISLALASKGTEDKSNLKIKDFEDLQNLSISSGIPCSLLSQSIIHFKCGLLDIDLIRDTKLRQCPASASDRSPHISRLGSLFVPPLGQTHSSMIC